MSIIRKMYDWAIREAGTKRAERALGAVSFAESSFFPIPPDVMLVPMILANPNRAWYLAGLATVTSVLGGLLGYAIGFFFMETAGKWIVDLYGLHDGFAKFHEEFALYGVWIIILKGITPIPYKLVTIASGMASFPLVPFILASIVCRAMRFFLIAALLRYFGDSARHFIEKYLPWVTLSVLLIVVLGFVVTAGIL